MVNKEKAGSSEQPKLNSSPAGDELNSHGGRGTSLLLNDSGRSVCLSVGQSVELGRDVHFCVFMNRDRATS